MHLPRVLWDNPLARAVRQRQRERWPVRPVIAAGACALAGVGLALAVPVRGALLADNTILLPDALTYARLAAGALLLVAHPAGLAAGTALSLGRARAGAVLDEIRSTTLTSRDLLLLLLGAQMRRHLAAWLIWLALLPIWAWVIVPHGIVFNTNQRCCAYWQPYTQHLDSNLNWTLVAAYAGLRVLGPILLALLGTGLGALAALSIRSPGLAGAAALGALAGVLLIVLGITGVAPPLWQWDGLLRPVWVGLVGSMPPAAMVRRYCWQQMTLLAGVDAILLLLLPGVLWGAVRRLERLAR